MRFFGQNSPPADPYDHFLTPRGLRRFLRDHASRINEPLPDSHGCYPLHRCAVAENLDAIRTLISQGADPNVTDDLGRTPLHIALTQLWPRHDVCQELIRAGAQVDLFAASALEDVPTLSAIFAATPPPVRLMDGLGNSALRYAAFGRNRANAQYLVTREMERDIFAGVFFGETATVGELLDATARDMNREFMWPWGFNPLDLAITIGATEIEALLRKRGIKTSEQFAIGQEFWVEMSKRKRK